MKRKVRDFANSNTSSRKKRKQKEKEEMCNGPTFLPEDDSDSDDEEEERKIEPANDYKDLFGEEEQKDLWCAICRQELKGKCEHNNDNICKICKVIEGTCNHFFHENCIKKWLEIKKCCPLCNVDFKFKDRILQNEVITKKEDIAKQTEYLIKKHISGIMSIIKLFTLDRNLALNLITSSKISPFNEKTIIDILGRDIPKLLTPKLKELNNFYNNPPIKELKKICKIKENVFTNDEIIKIIDNQILIILKEDEKLDDLRLLLKNSFNIFKDLGDNENFKKMILKFRELLSTPIFSPTSKTDLRFLDLSNIMFNEASFGLQVDFSNSNLSHSKFIGHGSGGACIHGIFKNTNCEYTTFDGYCMKTCEFRNCNLRNVQFNVITISRSSFDKCDLRNAFLIKNRKHYRGKELKEYLISEECKITNCKFEDENKQNNDCKICVDRIINTVIIPCGHTICYVCYCRILERQQICPFCPFCKKQIKSFNKIFI